MTYKCPVCESQNCEEKDRRITCLDCGAEFKVWIDKLPQKKPDINYCDRQVID